MIWNFGLMSPGHQTLGRDRSCGKHGSSQPIVRVIKPCSQFVHSCAAKMCTIYVLAQRKTIWLIQIVGLCVGHSLSLIHVILCGARAELISCSFL